MKILDDKKTRQTIARMVVEILEKNYEQKRIILGGINNNGMRFASILFKALRKKEPKIEYLLANVQINPANPTSEIVKVDLSAKELQNEVFILVDDVANTGRTLFYAFKPLMDVITKKIEVAVLIDRKHKSFPVEATYVGMSLATTLKQNIHVNLSEKKYEVFLE